MHIGIFTNNYLPNPYGVSTSIEGFRKELEKRGDKVSIFAPKWQGEKFQDSAGVYRYPSIKMPTKKVSFSVALPFSLRLNKIIDNLDFDLVHAQHPNLIGWQGKVWAKRKKIPLVYTWHALYERYAHYAYPIPEGMAAKFILKNAINFSKESDCVILPSRSMYDILIKYGFEHDNVNIVHSGVDEQLFANPDGKRLREKFQIPQKSKLLVSVSRITEEKNVLFLAKVANKVLKQDNDTYFIFGGTGDLVSEVRETFDDNVKNRVILPGKVPRGDVKHYLDAGDIFIYASTSETQGTIISEAMYIGIPVVAVNATGVKDMVIDGFTGYLTNESINDMYYAIMKCLHNAEDRNRLSKKAREYAKKYYTTKACTDKLIDVYEKTIERFK